MAIDVSVSPLRSAVGTQPSDTQPSATQPSDAKPPDTKPSDTKPSHTRALRAAFAQFATGVTVMTALDETPCGMTANAFTSLSMDPPLALVCVSQNSAMHAAVLRAGSFGVNVLSADQECHARYFADRTRPRGAAEFEGIAWHRGPESGVPLLAGALAWLECRLTDVHRGGDHSIFVGEVVAFTHDGAGEALIFHRGGFHRLPAPPESAAGE